MSTSPQGTLRRTGDAHELIFERRYPVTVDELWVALTEPGHLADWLPETTMTPGPGGHIDFDWGEQGKGRAAILTWEPPTVLEFEWVETQGRPSIVRFDLRSEGDGARLTLAHRDMREDMSENAAGWHYYLDALAAHIGGQPPLGDEHFDALMAVYASAAREHLR